MNIRVLLILLLLSPCYSHAQTAGIFKDARDGKTYKTVSYSIKHSKDSVTKVTWMAQNLNYEAEDSYPFDQSFENYELHERLYNWSAANKACPAGWHLPTDEEWYQLVDLFGGLEKAGKHLKAKKSLWPNGKGTNKSKFYGLPGGFMTKDGKWADYGAFFWSATESPTTPGESSDWSFIANTSKVRHWEGVKSIAQAVRCVKY